MSDRPNPGFYTLDQIIQFCKDDIESLKERVAVLEKPSTKDPEKPRHMIITPVVDVTYKGNIIQAGNAFCADIEYAKEYIDAGYAKPTEPKEKPLTKEVKENPGRPHAIEKWFNGDPSWSYECRAAVAYIERLEADKDRQKRFIKSNWDAPVKQDEPAGRPPIVSRLFDNRDEWPVVCEYIEEQEGYAKQYREWWLQSKENAIAWKKDSAMNLENANNWQQRYETAASHEPIVTPGKTHIANGMKTLHLSNGGHVKAGDLAVGIQFGWDDRLFEVMNGPHCQYWKEITKTQ